ncbi:MAG: gluconate 2-dehydrogenase subunit 3 family protein [Acidobacteriia bacterium]|nr:gluconate 2-dehydrogenase subunit 3 family protein [Terriglobia bacterium]
MKRPSRRSFIAAGIAVPIAACGRRGSPWRFFTVEEARMVEAVCAQIIPEDQDAGAAKAGVVHFMDTQLTRFYKPLQKTYRRGIAQIDQASIDFAGKPFADLASAQQVAVLHHIETHAELRPFFDLLVAHTMQGFYGDPRHGGNRDRVSWKMVGLPYPPLRGRLRYDFADPKKGELPWR